MTERTPALIDGSPVTADEHTEVRSPYDRALVGLVPRLGEAEIDRAVAVARRRHEEGCGPAHQRAEILDRVAALLAERAETFAQTITAESAKPISLARGEVSRAVDTVRFSAAVARTQRGETVPIDASAAGVGKTAWVARVPIGVVAAISPFNFPLNLVCHKLAPAVAAGCPVVLKPASTTPLSALALARLFEEAGLPPGWINVVTCPGSVAEHLVTHPDVSYVTFTGSAQVGWAIRAKAPRIPVGLELGNSAPVIIEPGVHVAEVAARVARAGFGFSGQTCISVQRIYVHRSIHAEFLDALAAAASALRVGDPADPDTDMSALITAADVDRVQSWVTEAEAEGARRVTVGPGDGQGLLGPTVLDQVTNTMRVCADEVFGPVVGVAAYDTLGEAIDLANDTRFGLQAGIFTPDLAAAMTAAAQLRFGGVMINEVPSWRADQMPYGGIGDSGNTREGPAYAIDEMTERRLVVVDPGRVPDCD